MACGTNPLAWPCDKTTSLFAYTADSTSWEVGLPVTTAVYAGASQHPPLAANLMSQTDYRYGGAEDCSSASSNTAPGIGDITRVTRWIDATHSVDTLAGYDAYGNKVCTADGNHNISQVTYDSTVHALPRTLTNAAGHVVVNQYYGIDGVAWSTSGSDPGLYPKLKSTTDANNTTTIYGYDVCGRTSSRQDADGLTTTIQYISFGAVGQQSVLTTSILGSSKVFFDGLGRTIEARKQGSSSGRWIDVTTTYLPTGSVAQTSTPYFDSSGSPTGYTTAQYDTRGRALVSIAPDGTQTTNCYNDALGLVTTIDANDHRTTSAANIRGQPTWRYQYTQQAGITGTCDASSATSPNTPYILNSAIQYKYDPLGRQIEVDLKAETTSPSPIASEYDWLGRRYFSSDPDMGNWSFTFDAAGNTTFQIDAKNHVQRLDYDQLNRLLRKHYCAASTPAGCASEVITSADVVFTYDDPAVANSKGRLTRMTDASGWTSYTYNGLGAALSTTKSFAADGVTLATGLNYDSSRRLQTVTYPSVASPSITTVTYSYDPDGNLSTVSDGSHTYATMSGYNEMGQVGTVNLANGGVAQTYQYFPNSYRTKYVGAMQGSTPIMALTYQYDANGNVTSIVDGFNPNLTQSFRYDELDRLTWAQSTGYNPDLALPPQGIAYNYDAVRVHVLSNTSDQRSYVTDGNGNISNDGIRSYVWNADNLPSSITINSSNVTTSVLYDGNGARVKKQTGSSSVLYDGNLFECVPAGGTCSQYIAYVFAGTRRLAAVGNALSDPGNVHYFNTDQLSSTRAVSHGTATDATFYGPFGQTITDSATDTRYKFTGQEWDAEIGLYNYGARIYDPALGRFMSADTKIPGRGIQAYNRYAYALNNPSRYNDPTGHSFFDAVGGFFSNMYKGVTSSALSLGLVVGTAVGDVASGGALTPALTGELVGASAAAQAHGNAFLGELVGGALGQLSSGISSGIPEGGNWVAQAVQDAGRGAIQGAGLGAASGFAGGRGDIQSMIRGGLQGAAVGGALGALKPFIVGRNVMDDIAGGEETTPYTFRELLGRAAEKDAQNLYPVDLSDDVVLRSGGLWQHLWVPGTKAMTLGNTINIGATTDINDIVHELAHVSEYQTIGGFNYFLQYGVFHLQYGYWLNPLERAAYGAEEIPW